MCVCKGLRVGKSECECVCDVCLNLIAHECVHVTVYECVSERE